MGVIYPGTFDPVTLGHLDIIRRARDIFGTVQVAVVAGSPKSVFFPATDRVNMLRDALADVCMEDVSVSSFDCLLVEYMRSTGATVFIRGLRANSDFEFEFQMQLVNRRLAPEITGIYMMPSENMTYISSTLVREVAMYGGDLSTFVTPGVQKALQERFSARYRTTPTIERNGQP
jgi:pantetheine-phosphate adenylyltransferase